MNLTLWIISSSWFDAFLEGIVSVSADGLRVGDVTFEEEKNSGSKSDMGDLSVEVFSGSSRLALIPDLLIQKLPENDFGCASSKFGSTSFILLKTPETVLAKNRCKQNILLYNKRIKMYHNI